jgi:intein-encoded DNA endonuclease-like protein
MDPTILAYIAGFLDGDGSIFFQLIRKEDYRLGFQIRTTIAFYQKTENENILLWLKAQFSSGYIRRRKTGISDYTIVEVREVQRILRLLQPYVRLKREHVRLGLEILQELPLMGDAAQMVALAHLVDRFQDINYSKKRSITSSVVEAHLISRGYLAPVETDPLRRESPGMSAAKTPVAFAASEG